MCDVRALDSHCDALEASLATRRVLPVRSVPYRSTVQLTSVRTTYVDVQRLPTDGR
jgi:hypothetical protein